MSEGQTQSTVEQVQREHIACLRGLLASKQGWYEEALAQERKERVEAQEGLGRALADVAKLRTALGICLEIATDASSKDLEYLRPLVGL
jgi:hypothetical protein